MPGLAPSAVHSATARPLARVPARWSGVAMERPTLRGLTRHLDGPAPVWARPLDRIAERWARAPARLRILVVAMVTTTVVASPALLPHRWGEPTRVVTAVRDLGVGTILGPGDLEVVALPASSVPDDAATAADGLVGSALRHPVAPGQPVLERHVAPDGLTGLVATGRVAVALPTELVPPLVPGQRLDVLGADDVAGGRVLADEARVLRVDGDIVWVEVARDETTAIAAALVWGGLTVAVLPAGVPP